jgi:hypothetical protein
MTESSDVPGDSSKFDDSFWKEDIALHLSYYRSFQPESLTSKELRSARSVKKSSLDGDRVLERLYDQQNTRFKGFRYSPRCNRTQVETQRIGVIGESAKVGLEFDD